MKIFLSTIIIFISFSFTSRTQDKLQYLSSDEIIHLIGGRLIKVFNTLDIPVDVIGCGENNNYDAILDYLSLAVKIRKKTVTFITFFKGWNKPVKNITIGDNMENVKLKLGDPVQVLKSKDNTPFLVWNLNELDSYLDIVFDEENKVKRISVELK